MTVSALKSNGKGIQGPLVLVILDGVGLYKGKDQGYPGNALDLANVPTIKSLISSAPISLQIQAHGTAVGMPSDDDMGNSEVGHNAIGAGRIFDQGAKLVGKAVESGAIFKDERWMGFIGDKSSPGLALKPKEDGSMPVVHFMGLLSDGNVHSHIDHLLAMVRQCHSSGVEQVRIHILLDGRDVNEVSALTYVDQLETVLKELDPSGKNYLIASGGGRMNITMDRYDANWPMVEKGWKTHVAGDAPGFPSTTEAIEKARADKPGIIDQDLPPFVIQEDGKPVGPIQSGDAVIFFNFRGDRAIEMSRAFSEENFSEFDRKPDVKVHFAGMMEYDGDLKIPPLYLVPPPEIDQTMSEYMAKTGLKTYALSETQKFGHVTYFWNGNNSQKFDDTLEVWEEIPSDVIPFEQKPAMKAPEITDALIKALKSGEYSFLRVNYANGDMVGHTGVLQAAIDSLESVDGCLKELIEACEETGATLIVTADHGNCEEMIETDKKTGEPKKKKDGSFSAKTSHTLNPVPFVITGKDIDKFQSSNLADGGLSNIAATVLTLMGYDIPKGYRPSLVKAKQ
ncbi:MAG: phosphoglycerate mutase (2,3-diphosphoglycerate-independent) [Spirochaetaceae bacterium]|nr:phosphoglycerate mutase (2,3-diphosphoglycerate-independent) [Spirochaetaceae bacterium]|tara:strand:- start:8942 stop:10642 length:1701 start_codon:yes stop_codon:yes gene_type:complete